MLPKRRRTEEVEKEMVTTRSWWAGVFVVTVGMAFQALTAAAEECMFVVASRESVAEAQQVAIEWGKKSTETKLVETRNGRFAISLGTMKSSSDSRIADLKAVIDLPTDSFCMGLSKVVREIEINSNEITNSDPILAEKDILGNLTCPRGFRLINTEFEQCERVDIPKNAELNMAQNDWICSFGYRKSGDACDDILLPKDAHINSNPFGLATIDAWSCDVGFRQVGESCEKVIVPKNASMNPVTSEVTCDLGFLRDDLDCREMDSAELLQELRNSLRLINLLEGIQSSSRTCNQIEDLCEETCDREFSYSYSPSEADCLRVCDEIAERC
jgi:hypothetical protein